MSILVLGASGNLGWDIYTYFKRKGHEVLGSYYSHYRKSLTPLDATEKTNLLSLFKELVPNIVINVIGNPSPDWCEKYKELARKSHLVTLKNIIAACRKYKSKLIHISTDYVFDGTENSYLEGDIANPINFYGVIKRKGELLLRKDSIILRLPLICGSEYFRKICTQLSAGEMNVDNYSIKHPTSTLDIVHFIDKLIKVNASGVFHFGNEKDSLTRYEWLSKISNRLNIDTKINPVVVKYKAPRPKNVVMNVDKAKNLGYIAQTVDEFLERCVWR